MKIGLYDLDSKIPNLALMRISAWHKAQGHETELYLPILHETYDKVYCSSIFDFSDKSYIQEDMILGGTGIDLTTVLPPEIDQMNPDYELYGYEHNLGFAMRGCRFKCGFCVVPRKEGKAHSKSTIRNLITNKTNSDFLMLLDNDFFGNPNWKDCIEEIKEMKLRVNFSQGLNIRILSEKQAHALASVHFTNSSGNYKQVTFAWDQIEDEKTIMRGFKRCVEAGIKPWQMQFYVLIGYNSTEAQDLHRVMTIKSLGSDPYVMPFNKKNKRQMRFTRWCNHRAIFNTVDWKDYKKAA
jgi:hypothetical protein